MLLRTSDGIWQKTDTSFASTHVRAQIQANMADTIFMRIP